MDMLAKWVKRDFNTNKADLNQVKELTSVMKGKPGHPTFQLDTPVLRLNFTPQELDHLEELIKKAKGG